MSLSRSRIYPCYRRYLYATAQYGTNGTGSIKRVLNGNGKSRIYEVSSADASWASLSHGNLDATQEIAFRSLYDNSIQVP